MGKDLPAMIFFRPGYENPKFVDAVELTHDDILEWTEKEIAKIRKEQGHDEFYQGEGLPKVGSADAATTNGQEEPKFKSREDVLKFLETGDEDSEKSCAELGAENKRLKAENARLAKALKAVHNLVKQEL